MTAPRKLLVDTRGVAASEMVLVLPMVAFITLNVVDLATYMYSKMQVDLAAQQAVGVVRQLCTATPAPPGSSCNAEYSTQMTDAAQKTALGAAVTLVGARTKEDRYCADTDGKLELAGASDRDCSGAIAGSTAAPGTYLSVQSSYAFSSVFPQASIASLLGSPITSTAWIRLK